MSRRSKRMPDTFEAMIQKERERLTKLREDAQARLEEINEEIAAIDREFEAIEAYERVKAGKAQKAGGPEQSGRQRARKGARQQELLDLIKRNPDGLTRREILDELGFKGDKKAEASASNALNGMKKRGQLRSEGRRYLVAE